jgi:hypothetical protein
MSTLIESLAQDRHAERYAGSRHPRHANADGDVASHQSPRTRAGWLLVGLGLRLALPGQREAARRITLMGR